MEKGGKGLDDNDDDDDDDDGDELFLWHGWPKKDVFPTRLLSEILTIRISNMQQAGLEPTQKLSSSLFQ